MSALNIHLRPATDDDVEELASIWNTGWRSSHLEHVPDELIAARTPESFLRRAAARVQDTTVAEVGGALAGFTMVVANEVEQFYVAAPYQGKGVAQTLMTAAEQQIAANGFREAWLAVIGANARARAFYARAGWQDQGPFVYEAYNAAGPISVPSHRYTKVLLQDGVE